VMMVEKAASGATRIAQRRRAQKPNPPSLRSP